MRISDRVRATRSLCGPTLVVMAGDTTIGVSLVDCAMATGIVTVVLVTVVLMLEVVGVITGAAVVVVVVVRSGSVLKMCSFSRRIA